MKLISSNPFKDKTTTRKLDFEMALKLGQQVWLDCKIHQGMFPDERTIRIELAHPVKKIISGFVPKEFVKGSIAHAKGQVAVTITEKPKNGKVSVLFPGEILTATNPVEIATSLLSRHAP